MKKRYLYVIKEVFLFLDNLINKFELHEILDIKGNKSKKRFDKIDKYVKKFLPDLVKYLESNFLNHEFITSQWIITFFSNSMKPVNLFKIWDFSIVLGWKFINFFIISILLEFKDKIMEYDINKLSIFTRSILKTEEFDSKFHRIIKQTFEFLLEFD